MTQIQNSFPPFSKGGKAVFWKFGFGYCLLFVIWCLEFSQSWMQLYLNIHWTP